MANKQATKKANRQNIARKAVNRSNTSRIKTERKKFHIATEKKAPQMEDLFKSTQSLLAKAAKTGLVHWKKAARLISRMAKKINK